MNAFLRNRWIRIGLALILLGWTPLFAIIFMAKAGMSPDPNPNPVGPGLLFFFTAWPAMICMGIGSFQAISQRGQGASTPEQRTGVPGSVASSLEASSQPAAGENLLEFIGLGALLCLAMLFFVIVVGGVAGLVLTAAAAAVVWGGRGRILRWFHQH